MLLPPHLPLTILRRERTHNNDNHIYYIVVDYHRWDGPKQCRESSTMFMPLPMLGSIVFMPFHVIYYLFNDYFIDTNTYTSWYSSYIEVIYNMTYKVTLEMQWWCLCPYNVKTSSLSVPQVLSLLLWSRSWRKIWQHGWRWPKSVPNQGPPPQSQDKHIWSLWVAGIGK